MHDVGSTGPIVVGIDGSPQARAALEWAIDEARLKKAELHIVVGWRLPNMLGWPVPLPTDFDPVGPAQAVVDETVKFINDNHADVVVRSHVEEGPAARSLIRKAQEVGASLLVVGARGHGEVAGMLIGSVSEYVATHAHCPVVIVRH